MKGSLSEHLTRLRHRANLTNAELAELADVPRSLVGGLQSGKRRIGEHQARKLADALGLDGGERDGFIFLAINQCSEKVLSASKGYPAELLNRLALLLRKAGILPDQVHDCRVVGDDLALVLIDGTQLKLEARLATA